VGFSARRYAQAVFELTDKGQIAEWQSDLDRLSGLGQDAAISAYMGNPKIRFEDKAKLLGEKLSDINPMVMNMVYLLLAGSRLNMLPDIAGEYRRLADNYHGIERAEVTAAIPFDDEARLRLSRHLGELTGKKIILEDKVDPELIGGVVVRVAGKLLDGSTLGKLAALKRKLR
jgi:F-type H+-transporting ATPase subunit delta